MLVNAMHITASVYINDDEPGLLRDYDDVLERPPHDAVYRHNETGETTACPCETPNHGARGRGGSDGWAAISVPGSKSSTVNLRRRRVLVKVIGE